MLSKDADALEKAIISSLNRMHILQVFQYSYIPEWGEKATSTRNELSFQILSLLGVSVETENATINWSHL